MTAAGGLPVLYSFRRCPYALRARMALAASQTPVELREVLLRDKPAEMLAVSPKGTVPVLQLTDGRVLDESLAIMLWALQRIDPDAWLGGDQAEGAALIQHNDTVFKTQLDRYKYFVRFPAQSQAHYRAQAEDTLRDWEQRIVRTGGGLVDTQLRLADAAVFPFVRQFAGVEPQWWVSAPYPALRQWLNQWTDSTRYLAAMLRVAGWQPGAGSVVVDWR
ncbi:glutathione S-transferase [Sinimarinibacterium sp. CAU 1509]|nr:glutathione S-transferase [Sinimarinibacterium sp. CAU 1509]